jgi:hypothetical protein
MAAEPASECVTRLWDPKRYDSQPLRLALSTQRTERLRQWALMTSDLSQRQDVAQPTDAAPWWREDVVMASIGRSARQRARESSLISEATLSTP